MKIEYLKSTKVVYFRRVGIYGTENKLLMQSFKKWVKAEELFQESTILGIALDNPQNTPAKDCRYDVCLITDKKRFKDNVEQRTLAGGTYAVFKVAHIEKVIIDFYMNIAQTIAKNQLNVLSKPIIERYKQNPVDKGYCEILIPIEQK
ncbi:GyrI-like domain-containing protein [Lactobacillus sp. UCMA15818]|uniref:AraC family transcriptional regulator n=1 Tax=Lactobacillus sp. UCMA15818 TaxID=2583394 RepID=UPI0025B27EF7|nr:GyrI-like domain-containing protein [Lactobacillus sp. UCMA15818]MDN2454452.1 DNA gyrase inhibitor [Lactobacillus sp. UCMA15818]